MTTTCARAGCGGTVLEDGFCDRCWLAPPADPIAGRPPTRPAPALPPPTASSSLTRTASQPASGVAVTGSRAALVEIPDVSVIDPASVVLSAPSVPEHRRTCSACNEPVGRSRQGEPGRVTGFCPSCGAAFDFAPKLVPGDVVGQQYEVAGCLAHGGMGWVYLAIDLKVERQWVVLKGLLDRGDHDAMAAALAERRFLAEVRHPNIVRILNFVEHEGDGYIVMEYVEGTSLRDERRVPDPDGRPRPLPVEHAIAYVLEVLPALGHLHARGIVYCDLKPDNVIHTPRSAGVNIKLIDLGGVRRLDDRAGPVFGTIGYQAPEVAQTGPTIATDLFTVGRMLAVLCTDFPTYQSIHRFSLPERDDVPLYRQHESLYRFLVRATAIEPDARFATADEMADQLAGVLREIVAVRTGVSHPGSSRSFAGPGRVTVDRLRWDALPRPAIDPDDPGAGSILATAQLEPAEALRVLDSGGIESLEIDLWSARMSIAAGDLGTAATRLDRRQGEGWRIEWYRGLVALAAGESAVRHFDSVVSELPGELAPKLALAVAAEADGDLATAAHWYGVVAITDERFTAASFGLARCQIEAGDRAGAVHALQRVPETSSAFDDASVATVELVLAGAHDLDTSTVAFAASVVEQIDPGDARRTSLEAAVTESALALVAEGRLDRSTLPRLFGSPTDERELRLRLERTLRSLAQRDVGRCERIALVDRANAVRPRSWL